MRRFLPLSDLLKASNLLFLRCAALLMLQDADLGDAPPFPQAAAAMPRQPMDSQEALQQRGSTLLMPCPTRSLSLAAG